RIYLQAAFSLVLSLFQVLPSRRLCVFTYEYVTSEMYSAFRVRLLSQAQALPSLVLSRPFLTQESTYISYVSYGCLHVGFLLLCSLCCNGGGFFILYDCDLVKV